MNPIVKTEAIVLRSIKYGETSKIITFYTKEMGRIGAIVKGIRKREGKFGSALEPMSWVQLVVYVKESREVQTVAQCDLLQSFHHISGDLDKISIGLALVEIVNTIAHEQEQNIPLFDLLKNSLVYLEEAETNISWVLFYFELKLAELLGFNPVFNFCGNCKKAITLENGTKWQMYNLLKGSPVCDGCSSSGEGLISISTGALRTLQVLHQYTRFEQIQQLTSDFTIQEETEMFLNKYLQAHISGFKLPRARKMFKTTLPLSSQERGQG